MIPIDTMRNNLIPETQMPKNRSTAPARQLPYGRLMLIMPLEQLDLLDRLAASLSQPGRPATRQDVIRHLVASAAPRQPAKKTTRTAA